MRVQIKAPHIIRVDKKEYQKLARGIQHTLPLKQHYAEGDIILIKEHDGAKYTGQEIRGQITTIINKVFTYRTIAITNDEQRGRQNASDARRKSGLSKYGEES